MQVTPWPQLSFLIIGDDLFNVAKSNVTTFQNELEIKIAAVDMTWRHPEETFTVKLVDRR